MITRRSFLSVCAGAGFAVWNGGCAPVEPAPPDGAGPATRRSTAANSTKLEIAPISQYPLVTVEVDDRTATFLLDTGSGSGVVVASDWLPATELAEEPRYLSEAKTPTVSLPDVALADGSPHATIPQATLHPFRAMRLLCGARVDGMLGWDSLTARAAEIDMPGRTFTIWQGSDGAPDAADGMMRMPAVRFRDMRQRPYTILRIGGRSIPVLLDTCELEAIKIPRHLLTEEDLDLDDTHRAGGTFDIMDEFPCLGVRGTLAAARLGDIELIKPQTTVLADPDCRQQYGVLGAPVLKNYRLRFDFWTGEVRLAGPRKLAAAAPREEAIQIADTVTGVRDADLANAD